MEIRKNINIEEKGCILTKKMKNDIILFENQGVKLEVNLKDETVWLNRQQLSKLFDRDIKTIGKHINNALKEELKDISTVAKFATVQKEGEREVTRDIEYYNLDMILSVGYRVKSDKYLDTSQAICIQCRMQVFCFL